MILWRLLCALGYISICTKEKYNFSLFFLLQTVGEDIFSEYMSSRQEIAFVLDALSTQMIEKFINLIPGSKVS